MTATSMENMLKYGSFCVLFKDNKTFSASDLLNGNRILPFCCMDLQQMLTFATNVDRLRSTQRG